MSKQSIVLFFMMYVVWMAIRLRARYGIRDRFYDGALFVATVMMFGLAAHIGASMCGWWRHANHVADATCRQQMAADNEA
jgi:hypothetical protein